MVFDVVTVRYSISSDQSMVSCFADIEPLRGKAMNHKDG